MSRERRPSFAPQGPETEPGHFGCPMLTRARFTFPSKPREPVMRCALGWALHDQIDVARCLATDVVTDCWQVHPERAPVVTTDAAAGPVPVLPGNDVAGE